ncbi:pentapeptide repeat-containing protein [Desulfobacula sp.]|uniref:pentapeptide repeat-containing protein n=1 Tax=Desulfobacula sp. TaxID=2593537 RepID=UPI00345D8BEC
MFNRRFNRLFNRLFNRFSDVRFSDVRFSDVRFSDVRFSDVRFSDVRFRFLGGYIMVFKSFFIGTIFYRHWYLSGIDIQMIYNFFNGNGLAFQHIYSSFLGIYHVILIFCQDFKMAA